MDKCQLHTEVCMDLKVPLEWKDGREGTLPLEGASNLQQYCSLKRHNRSTCCFQMDTLETINC